MTSSTEFTLNALLPLQNLNRLLSSRPTYSSGEAKAAWDKVSSVISSTDNAILSSLNQSISQVYTQGVASITHPISNSGGYIANQTEGIFDGIFDGIIAKIQGLIDSITGVWSTLTGWFDSIIDNITTTINNVYQWISGVINTARDWIVTTVSGVYEGVKGFVTSIIDTVSDWVSGVYTSVRDWIVNAVDTASGWVSDTYNTISEWIKGVVQGIVDTYNSVKETVEEKIQKIIEWVDAAKVAITAWWEGIKGNISKFISKTIIPNLDKLIAGAVTIKDTALNVFKAIQKGDFQGAFNLIDNLFKGAGLPAPVQTLMNMVSVIAYFWETVRLQFVGMEYAAQKNAQVSLAREPLDLGTTTQMVYRGLMSQNDFISNASLAGIAKDKSEHVVEASRPLPSPGDIQQSFLRGEIDLKTHDKLLTDYGFSANNIELIKELYLIIPNVPDLIRMAVREAFTPEIAKAFGQYEDFPPEFAKWGAKQGLSEEWCQRYWAAHWDLPSPQMGYEMLHRGVISDSELKLLLRALDIMPFWREKLVKISYNPLTRVDVRRMYQAGVLTEAQVKRAYLDLGYDDIKANWLTQFTVRYYTPEDQSQQDEFKALARGTYSTAYKKHVISEDEYRQFLTNLKYYPDDIDLLVSIDNYAIQATDKLFDPSGYRKDWQKLVISAYDRGLIIADELKTLLMELGYTEMEVTLEINLSDYNRQLSIRNLVANQVHDQYVDFIIDNVTMYSLLDQFNFSPPEIDKLQEEWDIERVLRVKRPSLTDLKAFFKAGLLSLDELLDELRGEGYNEKYIPMYQYTLSHTGA